MMAQTLPLDIKIPEGSKVEFRQDATFENFVSQFQPFCDKLLCVVDGTSLRYYDKMGPLPNNLRFDYKQRRGSYTEYYFRDIDDQTLYCVFGRDSARVLYHRIDQIDPVDKETPEAPKKKPIIQAIKPSMPLFREKAINNKETVQRANQVIIVDKGVKFTFSDPNFPVEVRTYYPS